MRLPDKLFLTGGKPVCLFILSKSRDGKDGEHRELNNQFLFIDPSKMGAMVSRKLRIFNDQDVSRIVIQCFGVRALGTQHSESGEIDRNSLNRIIVST